MTAPVIHIRVDWANAGAFSGAYDDVTAFSDGDLGPVMTRGRSADNSAEATGAASFTLDNFDDRFTPDRNWCDNPSFEAGTAGWSIAAIASLTAVATSITQVTDNAPGAGSKAGEAVLTATVNSGVTFPIPYPFRSGVTYAVSVYLKSTAGTLTVRAGLASSGTPADIASSGADITTSWAVYTFAWTPSADRADAVFFVRTTTAATATVRIDAVQVNPGGTANPYLEAPTKGQLVPGRPVHIYATHGGTDYPQFYGYIERLAPDPADRMVTITCYDVLRRLGEVDATLPTTALTSRTALDCRTELLTDFERGDHNLLQNPSFETDLSGWTLVAGGGDTLTRVTTDAAPEAGGTCCAEMVTATALSYLQGAAKLVPVFFVGQTYRASVYLRATTGTPAVTVGLGRSHTTYLATRTFTISTTWTRYTVTWTVDTETTAGVGGLLLFVEFPAGTGTLRVDGGAVTRGQALLPYSGTGSGRWPNYCGAGSFDGGGLNGWYGGWTNLCGNGNFETDVAGWSVAADSFHAAATSITRSTAQYHRGAASALLTTYGVTGCHYAVTGTFLAGVTYRLRFYFEQVTTPRALEFGIGSNGTPADYAYGTDTGNTSWEAKYVDWTPSANRSDVHAYLSTGIVAATHQTYIDEVTIYERSSEWVTGEDPPYVDAGPGGMTTGTTAKATSTTAKYGTRSHSFDTRAVAGSGRIYDFLHLGSYFVAGRAYTASCWIRSSDASAPIKIGLAATAGTTWDEATATGSANNSGWTQFTVTWTPAADFPTAGATSAMRRVFTVCQTDATARTLYIDGVRVIPGSSADDWTMTHWDLDTASEASDLVSDSAAFTGSALSNLSSINALTLTRHYIRPAMTAPWYAYVTSDRDGLASKTSVETFDDDLAGMSSAEIDRASIVNILPVVYSPNPPTTEYYSDAASVARYGPSPGSALAGSAFYSTRATPDIVGPALVARYKDPRARPVMTVVNRFPSQLQRELDDLVTVNFARLRIQSGKYLILRITTLLTDGGTIWTTAYALEEYS